MTSPSPVTDGKTVWLLTGTGVIRAFDFNGKTLWTRDLQKDYGTFGLNHGYGSSPLLDRRRPRRAGAARHAHRRSVVRAAVSTARPGRRSGGSNGRPTPFANRPTPTRRRSRSRQGKAVEIVVTGGDVVTGHDPATGKELWRSRGLNPENNPFNRIIASPLVVRRDCLRADARQAAAGPARRRPRRRDRHAPAVVVRQGARRADAGLRRHATSTSSTTAASSTVST